MLKRENVYVEVSWKLFFYSPLLKNLKLSLQMFRYNKQLFVGKWLQVKHYLSANFGGEHVIIRLLNNWN